MRANMKSKFTQFISKQIHELNDVLTKTDFVFFKQEIKNVFAAYGIEVDYRHLSLLADYMTFEGTYKAFNRRAIETCASCLQQMSFETTMNFLVKASLQGAYDNLKSPSSQIVAGKPISCGSGAFELLYKLF